VTSRAPKVVAEDVEPERDPAPEADNTPPPPVEPEPTLPPPVPPLTAEGRAVIRKLATELPLHGRAALALPRGDAPEAAWLAVADALTFIFAPRSMSKTTRAAIVATTRPLGPALRALVPTHRRYRLLQEALRRTRAFPLTAEPIPATPYKLRAGKTAPEIALVRARLLREGYGDPGVEGKLLNFFDNRLKRALQSWQKDHGLPYTSVIDSLTRRRLNEDRPHPAALIALALERWRALDFRHDDGKTIIVHLNAFQLQAESSGAVALTMPVVVGKATETDVTPTQSAPIEAVIFNPRWIVPPRITRDTLRPSAGDDPEKLIARGYDVEVLADGRWRVRMGAGPDNPLGRVKFTLVGTGGVYLHDTPGRHAFHQSDRSLSHGCVRLGDALSLARWLLPNVATAVSDVIDSPNRTQSFRLDPQTVVHLTYQTITADENFELHIFPDIYGRDPGALAEINAATILAQLDAMPAIQDGAIVAPTLAPPVAPPTETELRPKAPAQPAPPAPPPPPGARSYPDL